MGDSYLTWDALGGERVRLPGSPDLYVLASFEVEFHDYANRTVPPSDYDARVLVSWDRESEKYVAERFEVIGAPGNPVTTTGMRQVPVAHFVAWACEIPGVVVDPEGRDAAALDYFSPTDISAAKKRGPTAETLIMVAVTYRAAAATGWKPAQRVTEVFDLPRRTATHWIKLARERGRLLIDESRDDG